MKKIFFLLLVACSIGSCKNCITCTKPCSACASGKTNVKACNADDKKYMLDRPNEYTCN